MIDINVEIRNLGDNATAEQYAQLLAVAADSLVKAEKTLRDCRNELCLRCGDYHESYRGSCDGCRWYDLTALI